MLARSGVGSRRGLEALIGEGRVRVNGETARLGMKIAPGDRVTVDLKPVRLRFDADEAPRVLLYHKLPGEIVSRDDPEGRASVFDRLPRLRRGKWVAVGRLDFNTSGLLVLTDSGDLAERMAHPRFAQEREYAARVRGELSAETIARLLAGIRLDDGPARFDSIVPGGGEGANRWYSVVLHEGRNREVRRLFDAVGHPVSRLIRVRFGPLRLPPRLLQGRWEELAEDEVAQLRARLLGTA